MSVVADQRREMGPTLFVADWREAVFIHYRIAAHALQPFVPFPLHERDGSAWVSLVAFTMDRLRAPRFGRLAEVGLRLLTPCRFLNLRTYVHVDGETGIFFLREWISNALSVPLGPVSFGLPYHAGRLDYAHGGSTPRIHGEVRGARDARLTYEGTLAEVEAKPAPAGSLDEFLVARYTAFTSWRTLRRRFRIRHTPWPSRPLELRLSNHTLLAATAGWTRHLEYSHATHTPGVFDVEIGYPQSA